MEPRIGSSFTIQLPVIVMLIVFVEKGHETYCFKCLTSIYSVFVLIVAGEFVSVVELDLERARGTFMI